MIMNAEGWDKIEEIKKLVRKKYRVPSCLMDYLWTYVPPAPEGPSYSMYFNVEWLGDDLLVTTTLWTNAGTVVGHYSIFLKSADTIVRCKTVFFNRRDDRVYCSVLDINRYGENKFCFICEDIFPSTDIREVGGYVKVKDSWWYAVCLSCCSKAELYGFSEKRFANQ